MPEHEQSVCCLNMIGYKVSAGYGKRKNGIGSIYCKAIEKLVVWKLGIAILPIMIARGDAAVF